MRRFLLSLVGLAAFGGVIAFGGPTLFASWGAPSAPEPWENAAAQEAWAQAYARLESDGAAEFPWETSAPGDSCEAVLYYSSNSADRYVSDTNLCNRFGGGERGVKMVYGEREDDRERRERLYSPRMATSTVPRI